MNSAGSQLLQYDRFLTQPASALNRRVSHCRGTDWLGPAGESRPDASFPRRVKALQQVIADTLRVMHERFPNLKIAYLSSRTYGGYATSPLNPEPHAYEGGFAVKWLIADQIAGKAELNYSPSKGPVLAPWCEWGPYLWADGTKPNRDGLSYVRADYTDQDGTHPSPSGPVQGRDATSRISEDRSHSAFLVYGRRRPSTLVNFADGDVHRLPLKEYSPSPLRAPLSFPLEQPICPNRAPMIKLTRLSRESLVLNSDLIEHVEANPDTVITLTTGQKLRVSESADEVIQRVIECRRAIYQQSCRYPQPIDNGR